MERDIVGIDVGGTHTDFLLLGEDGRIKYVTKVPTTPESPIAGILEGRNELPSPENISTYINGTTIATNALLQHKLPKVALITTKGFRDVLLIRRETKENIYDLYWDKPKPLTPRRLIFEINGRMDYKGVEIQPLNLSNLPFVVDQLKKEEINNIAVCLIHSYANNDHEIAVREELTKIFPEARVTLSSEIWPQWREFERTYNTVLNSSLVPIISNYIESILEKFGVGNKHRTVFMMQASGGIIGAEEIVNKPVLTLNSGVAAGAIGGAYLADHSGFSKVITFDMGGTSTDMGIVENSAPIMTSELFLEWEGTLGFSAVDAKSIGAGGGSIAWLDEVGALHVGPQSAGADPGPASYDRGGIEPTVTDAHVHLGYINPDMFLGGKARLNVSGAKEALNKLGKQTGLDDKGLALGILRIINANMLNGLRYVSIEKGYDPREFILVCFGGTGPLHAAALMKELGVPKALIPIFPGNVSAFGMVAARPTAGASRTLYQALNTIDKKVLEPIFISLENRVVDQLTRSGIPRDEIELTRSLDMRYQGQTYEINVPLDKKSSLKQEQAREHIAELFNAEHKRRYTYANPGEPIMIVHVRVNATGSARTLRLESREKSEAIPEIARRENRTVYLEVNEKPTAVQAEIYWRPSLTYGNRISGPAVIEEGGSTTLVPPGFIVTVDEILNMVMEETS